MKRGGYDVRKADVLGHGSTPKVGLSKVNGINCACLECM